MTNMAASGDVFYSSARLITDIIAEFALLSSPIGGEMTTTLDSQKGHKEEEVFWRNIVA